LLELILSFLPSSWYCYVFPFFIFVFSFSLPPQNKKIAILGSPYLILTNKINHFKESKKNEKENVVYAIWSMQIICLECFSSRPFCVILHFNNYAFHLAYNLNNSQSLKNGEEAVALATKYILKIEPSPLCKQRRLTSSTIIQSTRYIHAWVVMRI